MEILNVFRLHYYKWTYLYKCLENLYIFYKINSYKRNFWGTKYEHF